MADILDEVVGRTESASDETHIKNPEPHRLYQEEEVDPLADEEQKDLPVVLDSLVKRSRMDKVMAG